MVVETPRGILVGRANVLLRKVDVSRTDAKPRRSKRIDQMAAAYSIQGRDVPPDTRGYKVLVSVAAADGSVNKAVAERLKKRLVIGVVAVVTLLRRTAGNQKGS